MSSVIIFNIGSINLENQVEEYKCMKYIQSSNSIILL